MDLNYSACDFAQTFKDGKAQVVWSRVRADTETPVSAFLKLASDPHGKGIKPFSFLLESVEGGKTWGRYSILTLDPDLAWRHKDGRTGISLNPMASAPVYRPCPIAAAENSIHAPLRSFQALSATVRVDFRRDRPGPETAPETGPETAPETTGIPPAMTSGLFGYMGYDMVRHMERLPDTTLKVLDVAESLFVRPRLVLVFDRLSETLLIAAPVYPGAGTPAHALDAAVNRIAGVKNRLAGALPGMVPGMVPGALPGALSRQAHETLDAAESTDEPASHISPTTYQAMVGAAKDYIAAGDIFQVVLSQRFEMPFPLPPFELYRSLRRINPSPYLFFLNFDGYAIAGSSPEVLVRLKDAEVTVRPIAGTRPRGANPREDAALAADLLADEKELAEHLMLLDLGRNDVGRVAKTGSVTVTEEFKIELYSHVMHIVSNVTGQLAADKTALDALVAGFPAGTVSGAPKVRAMEIIEELEPEKRGIYAGAVGYVDANGETDTCIALRTAVIKDGTLYIQAGAGIVADSDPASEHAECQNKARAVVRAAQDAIRIAASKAN